MFNIPQNIFWIIIAVISVLGFIIMVMQWRRVKLDHTSVEYLDKLSELKKLDLKYDYLESLKFAKTKPSISKNQQEQLLKIRGNPYQIIQEIKYLQKNVDKEVKSLKKEEPYQKIQKSLLNLEYKKDEIEKDFRKTLKRYY